MRDVQRWHEREHRPGPTETCWDCGRQRAKCKGKLFRYTCWDEAVFDAQRMNEADSYVKPRAAYHCPWCDLYHLSTTHKKNRSDALKRQMRKWMFQRELERRRLVGDRS